MSDERVVWSPLPGSQTLAMSCPAQIIVYHGSRGPGKGLPLDEPVYTEKGPIPIGKLKIGDTIACPDGSSSKIIGVYPQGIRPVYEITFFDGAIARCDDQHIWAIHTQDGNTGGSKVEYGYSLMTMDQVIDRFNSNSCKLHVPTLDSLKMRYKVHSSNNKLPVDAYLLGLILGDGCFGQKGSYCTVDDELANYILLNGGIRWSNDKRSDVQNFGFSKELQSKIKLLNMASCRSDSKFIPEQYLHHNDNNRLAILQGLMDTDGTIDKNGYMTFNSASEELSKGVQYLVRSLGGNATLTRKPAYIKDVRYKDTFEVYIQPGNKFIPFRLERKVSRVKPYMHKKLWKRIESIIRLDDAETVCIKIDHPLGLFITRDFVVTHNTDSQLMRFRAKVGQGYGRHWRGVIFDREYKNLDDLVSKSQRWFPEFKDGCRFINSKSDYKWVWKTGEELLFRTVKKDQDYWGFHGQEFCLAKGELVSTPNGDVPIENLKVGDYVLTAIGPRKINRVFPEKLKPCVDATVFDKEGNLIGKTRFSANHKVLSNDLTHWIKHLDGRKKKLRFPLLATLLQSVLKFDFYSHLKNLGVVSYLQPSNLKILILKHYNLNHTYPQLVEFLNLNNNRILNRFLRTPLNQQVSFLEFYRQKFFELNFAKVPTFFQFLLRHVPLLNLISLPRLRIFQYHSNFSTRYYDPYKFELLERMNIVKLNMESLGYSLLSEFHSQIVRFLKANDQLSNVLRYPGKALNYLFDYLFYQSQYDEQPPLKEGIYQDVALLNADAIKQFHFGQKRDDKEYELYNNQKNLKERLFYIHPYSNERIEAILPFQEGKLLTQPCGNFLTIDIEVDEANSYIIPSNLLNCNCFIGWNELTKYPNSNLFEMMMSCNRSSFRAEDHPYYINKDLLNRKGLTQYVASNHKFAEKKLLPEIPLEVFATCNPHGAGHFWVKKRFISASKMGEILKNKINVYNPRTQQREDVIKTQTHIFGSYRENKYLSPEYVATLESIDEPNKRRAWLMGDWDVVAGGMFDDLWDSKLHIVSPFDVPDTWRIDRSFDWGSSHPFSVGWWAESDGCDVKLQDGTIRSTIRGDIYRIGEWYGWTGKPNEGLRMLANDISKGIIERELVMGIYDRVNPGPADNSIYDVENGNSIGASMAMPVRINGNNYPGVTWIRSDKSSGSRKAGWEKMRLYMKQAKPEVIINPDTKEKTYLPREKAGIFIFNTCKMFIDLVPILPRDDVDPDDVDTDAEDHIGDEARYKLLSIGIGAKGGRTSGTY